MKTAVRRKTAINAAAASSLAAALFIGIPAAASPSTMPYVCTWPGAPVTATATLTDSAGKPTATVTTTSTPTITKSYDIPMVVDGPGRATAGRQVTVTWKMTQPTTPPSLNALDKVPAGGSVRIDGDLIADGDALDATPSNATVVPVNIDLESGSPIPMPNLVMTVTPTAAGLVTFSVDKFNVSAVVNNQRTAWQKCVVNPAVDQVAALAMSVAASPSPRTTHTVTATASTPEPTQTITATVTATTTTPAAAQVHKTPKGAAQTGEAMVEGPSAKALFWLGALMLVGSLAMGVVWRRRMARSLTNGTPS